MGHTSGIQQSASQDKIKTSGISSKRPKDISKLEVVLVEGYGETYFGAIYDLRENGDEMEVDLVYPHSTEFGTDWQNGRLQTTLKAKRISGENSSLTQTLVKKAGFSDIKEYKAKIPEILEKIEIIKAYEFLKPFSEIEHYYLGNIFSVNLKNYYKNKETKKKLF